MRIAAALALAAAPLWAETLVIDVARELRDAWLVAEAEVLEVEDPTENRKKHPNAARVRVTRDPQRIFRGHEWLGAELDLKVPPDGAGKCTMQLRPGLGDPQSFLLVAGMDKMLLFGGYVGPTGYRLRAWNDLLGGWRIECGDAALGAYVAEGEHKGAFLLDRGALARLHRDEGRAFWARVAQYVTAEPAGPEKLQLDRLVALLSSGSARDRDYAQATLLAEAGLHLFYLRRALEAAGDPEARRRLRTILDGFERVIAVAQLLPEGSKRYVVEEALPALEGEARARAERWLARQAAEEPGSG